MIRAGLRRVLVLVLVVVGGAAAISATISALAGRSVPHALATGYYLAGAGTLILSIAFGVRGPTRVERSDDAEADLPTPIGVVFGSPSGGRAGRRQRRKATPQERRQAKFASVGLFVFGVLLVVLGAAIDPTRRAF